MNNSNDGYNSKEDPNYPPTKNEVNKSSKNKNSKNKSSNIKVNKSSKKTKKVVKVIKPENDFGLGIEHEVCYTISNIKTLKECKSFIEKVIKNKLSSSKTKELVAIYKKYKSIQVIYPMDYKKIVLPHTNIEFTNKGTVMIETKNLDYHNVSLDKVINEMNKNKAEIITELNKNLDDKIGKYTIDETLVGSHNILSFETELNESSSDELKEKDIKLYQDYTGSYHFWITLPSKKKDDINITHQKAMYLLQSIEPLLVSIFSSSDPNKSKNAVKGSYRNLNNTWALYGFSNTYNYDSLDSRVVGFGKEYRKSHKLGTSIYLDKLMNNITSPINTTKIPDYTLIEDKKWLRFGADFRRKQGINGFEFRIMDHFPEKYLEDVAKILYLIATHTYQIVDSRKMEYPLDNNSWNSMMHQSLINGSDMKIENDYVEHLDNQFRLNFKITKNSEELLQDMIDKLFDKVSKNKKHPYWLLVGKSISKPKIVNINKISLKLRE